MQYYQTVGISMHRQNIRSNNHLKSKTIRRHHDGEFTGYAKYLRMHRAAVSLRELPSHSWLSVHAYSYLFIETHLNYGKKLFITFWRRGDNGWQRADRHSPEGNVIPASATSTGILCNQIRGKPRRHLRASVYRTLNLVRMRPHPACEKDRARHDLRKLFRPQNSWSYALYPLRRVIEFYSDPLWKIQEKVCKDTVFWVQTIHWNTRLL